MRHLPTPTVKNLACDILWFSAAAWPGKFSTRGSCTKFALGTTGIACYARVYSAICIFAAYSLMNFELIYKIHKYLPTELMGLFKHKHNSHMIKCQISEL